eukprot:TRINITY_DN70727_c0_g1_i1.p1 TRINITY_DN70727_c0_g1~~TRINITY_DN70727_c0_g1_i1.p1  ORF type:complete len:500 (+),score=106.09 TRINITY_DN70727_c0_g1_i1:112-1611(+)
MAVKGYGAADDTTTADLRSGAPRAGDSSVAVREGDGVGDPELKKAARRRSIARYTICALLTSVVCGFVSMSTAQALERKGVLPYDIWHNHSAHPHKRKNHSNDFMEVPVCAALPHTASNASKEACARVNMWHNCKVLGYVVQPVYIGMLQSSLLSVIMTFTSMLPPPLGGGDPWHPGIVGITFAGWNVYVGCQAAFSTWFLILKNLRDDWWESYEWAVLLALQDPSFQAMCTIFLQKAVAGYWTIIHADDNAGKMYGWRLYFSINILMNAAVGIAVLVVPVFFTHILAQVVFFPFAVLQNLFKYAFYKMIFIVSCAVIVSVALMLGPGVGLMRLSAHLHKPRYGNDGTAAIKFVTNKCSAVVAFLLVAFIQDYSVNSSFVYHGVSWPGPALLAPFSVRKTCTWAACIEQHRNQTQNAPFLRFASMARLTPVLELAVLGTGDCRDPHGKLIFSGNILVPLGLAAALFFICGTCLHLNRDFLRQCNAWPFKAKTDPEKSKD